MKVHDLSPAPGSRRRAKRVARGIAGKGGKTAGRGMKGQKARNKVPAGFEGGQMPFAQRIPILKGFNNPFRVEYQAVNLDTIEESGLTEITPETLYDRGLISKKALRNLDTIKELPIKKVENNIVRLDDIANIEFGPVSEKALFRTQSKDALN